MAIAQHATFLHGAVLPILRARSLGTCGEYFIPIQVKQKWLPGLPALDLFFSIHLSPPDIQYILLIKCVKKLLESRDFCLLCLLLKVFQRGSDQQQRHNKSVELTDGWLFEKSLTFNVMSRNGFLSFKSRARREVNVRNMEGMMLLKITKITIFSHKKSQKNDKRV